jgi:hypothetical protein
MVKRMIVKLDEKNAHAAGNVSHPAPRMQLQLKKDIASSLIEKKELRYIENMMNLNLLYRL